MKIESQEIMVETAVNTYKTFSGGKANQDFRDETCIQNHFSSTYVPNQQQAL
jgi:hypothetical protein